MKSYTVQPGGERLDVIAKALYGRERGAVETLLSANPGLAAGGFIVAAGTEILVPAEAPAAAKASYQLAWE